MYWSRAWRVGIPKNMIDGKSYVELLLRIDKDKGVVEFEFPETKNLWSPKSIE